MTSTAAASIAGCRVSTVTRLPAGPSPGARCFFKENDSCFNLLLAALLILAWKEKYFSGKIRHPLVLPQRGWSLVLFYAWVKVLKKKDAARTAA